MSGNRSDIKAGSAFIELFVKDEKLRSGLSSAKGKLAAFGQAAVVGHYLIDIAKGIWEPIQRAVEGFSDFSDSLTKMSQRTGVSAQMLQKLSYVAQQSGTNLEDVEKALKNFEQTGHAPGQFLQLLENISAIESPALRAKRALDLFGKRGFWLLPMIEQLHALGSEFDRLALSEEQIKLGDELSTSFTRMRRAIKAAMDQIAASVAPAIKMLVEYGTQVIKIAAGIARDFPLAARIAFGLAVALTGVAAGFLLVTATATVASAAVSLLTGAIALLEAVGAPVLLLAAACVVLTAWLWFVRAAVVAVVTYFLLYTKVGRKLLDTVLQPLYWLLRKFSGFGEIFKQTFGAIGEALKQAEIGKAWEILLLGMSAAWHRFAATVLTGIANLIQGFRNLSALGIINPIADAIAANAQQFARDAALSNKLDEQSRMKDIARIQKELQAKKPGDKGYGGGGERSSAAIGFNARSALMSSNIIGAGKEEKMLDTLQSILRANQDQVRAIDMLPKKLGLKVAP